MNWDGAFIHVDLWMRSPNCFFFLSLSPAIFWAHLGVKMATHSQSQCNTTADRTDLTVSDPERPVGKQMSAPGHILTK